MLVLFVLVYRGFFSITFDIPHSLLLFTLETVFQQYRGVSNKFYAIEGINITNSGT